MSNYKIAFEQNAATITTNASGAGTFTATQLQQVSNAILIAPGYSISVSSISGQAITFQAKQTGGTASAFANPTSAVSFDPNTITVLEYGY